MKSVICTQVLKTAVCCGTKKRQQGMQTTHRTKTQRLWVGFLTVTENTSCRNVATTRGAKHMRSSKLLVSIFYWRSVTRKQSVIVQSDSFADLTNHVSTRSDQLSEEKIIRDIMKPAEQTWSSDQAELNALNWECLSALGIRRGRSFRTPRSTSNVRANNCAFSFAHCHERKLDKQPLTHP